MEESSFKLYERLLRLGSDWKVVNINVDDNQDEIHVTVEYRHKEWIDKTTGEVFSIYDHRQERVWRHLDSMEHSTFIHCRLPRVKTSGGKLHTIDIVWAESGISHTKKFENKSIETLQATRCQKTASDLMKISDDRMCGIMHRSVLRGIEKRDLSSITELSLDEKSYKKGYKFISVLTNSETGVVLEVSKDRTEQSADDLINKTFNTEQLENIKTTCCDMWDPFINTLKKTVRMPAWFMTNFMLSNI